MAREPKPETMRNPPAAVWVVEAMLLLPAALGVRDGLARWKRGSDTARSDRALGLAEAAACAGAGVWMVTLVHFGDNDAGLWAGLLLLVSAACLGAVSRVFVAIERHEENERRRAFEQTPRRNMGLLRLVTWAGAAYVYLVGWFVLSVGLVLGHRLDNEGAFDRAAGALLGGWALAGIPAWLLVRWRLRVAQRREDDRI